MDAFDGHHRGAFAKSEISLVWSPLFLLDGVAGEFYTQFLENLLIYLAEHHGGVNLASFQ